MVGYPDLCTKINPLPSVAFVSLLSQQQVKKLDRCFVKDLEDDLVLWFSLNSKGLCLHRRRGPERHNTGLCDDVQGLEFMLLQAKRKDSLKSFGGDVALFHISPLKCEE